MKDAKSRCRRRLEGNFALVVDSLNNPRGAVLPVVIHWWGGDWEPGPAPLPNSVVRRTDPEGRGSRAQWSQPGAY